MATLFLPLALALALALSLSLSRPLAILFSRRHRQTGSRQALSAAGDYTWPCNLAMATAEPSSRNIPGQLARL
eukprot:2981395-Pyramimonas_sp.AAC.1